MVRVNIDESPFTVAGLDVFTEFSAVSASALWREREYTGVRVDPDGEHVWIDPEILASAADTAGMPSSWVEGFARMRSFADTRGWLDDRGWIRAHVVIGR